MNIQQTAISGLLLFTPRKFADSRGAFWETYNERLMQQAGLPTNWKQDNTSVSTRNVIRGIHYQITQAQGKLVRVTYGSVFDVAVDLRRSSPTFGHHVGAELSEENGAMLWIPPGFAHGFRVVSESAHVLYKATDYYEPAAERTLAWNDPQLKVDWRLDGEPIVSSKDQHGIPFRDAEKFE